MAAKTKAVKRSVPCPRCGGSNTEALRNYGRPIAERFQCLDCQRWFDQQAPVKLAPAAALQAQFEKLVAKAARAGIAVVVDADTIAIRLIPRAVVDRGDDLRQLGDVVRVHGACGGMTGSGGGHPHGVY